MIPFWILVIAGLVLLIRWLIRMGKGGTGARERSLRALDILRERYAKGEIEQNKRDLTA